MLGITSGTFRNKFSYCMWGDFPHCCCRGYIFVFEGWKSCPADTTGHVQRPLSVQLRGTGADGAGASSDSKTASGKKKSSLRGLVCFLWMNSAPHAGCQLQGLPGDAQVCPAPTGAFAVLQEHMERTRCASVYGCWTKESRGHREECATVTDSWGSLGIAQISQFYRMLNGNSRESWYFSSAIAQFLNKFCCCRNRAGLDHSVFLKDKHQNPNHVCIC